MYMYICNTYNMSMFLPNVYIIVNTESYAL